MWARWLNNEKLGQSTLGQQRHVTYSKVTEKTDFYYFVSNLLLLLFILLSKAIDFEMSFDTSVFVVCAKAQQPLRY